MRIEDMVTERIKEYGSLYMAVFNEKPWNDEWTPETAERRIIDMMHCPNFKGMALYEGEQLLGLIWGQMHQYFNGVNAEILEFLVASGHQGEGLGTKLLDRFTKELKEQGVHSIYLITARGEKTQGFYEHHGFTTSDYMIFMNQDL